MINVTHSKSSDSSIVAFRQGPTNKMPHFQTLRQLIKKPDILSNRYSQYNHWPLRWTK